MRRDDRSEGEGRESTLTQLTILTAKFLVTSHPNFPAQALHNIENILVVS
jgi:hypothetical protein